MGCHFQDVIDGNVLEQQREDQAPFQLPGVLSTSLFACGQTCRNECCHCHLEALGILGVKGVGLG